MKIPLTKASLQALMWLLGDSHWWATLFLFLLISVLFGAGVYLIVSAFIF